MALDNLRPQERKKILDELAQLEQDYAQQVKQIQTEAADDAAKSWQGVASTIEGAVNSQLKSVLSGGGKLQDGMAKVAEDIAMKFMEKGEQIVMNWLANQAAMRPRRSRRPWFRPDIGYRERAQGNLRRAGETAAGVRASWLQSLVPLRSLQVSPQARPSRPAPAELE